MSTRQLALSIILSLILAACGSRDGPKVDTPPTQLPSPLLANASDQIYTANAVITPLSFSNGGGRELTACSADDLPEGLIVAVSENGITCEVSGTPTIPQAATAHTISAVNVSGTSSATVTITVNEGLLLPSLDNLDAQSYITNKTVVPIVFTNTGGTSLTECSADSLPSGLQVTIASGGMSCEISGTPTTPQTMTTHTITARNIIGESTATIAITVEKLIPFITTWKTDNEGASNDNQITITTSPNFNYNFQVDWGDGSIENNVAGDVTHTYTSPGIYTVEITGDFPQIYFSDGEPGNDPKKLLSIEQWGNQPWLSMEKAFQGCSQLVLNANDIPDLSLVVNMSRMFEGASIFNQDIGGWDVSSVTDMSFMFSRALAFNQDIGDWDVSSVTDMNFMFYNIFSVGVDIGGAFNQDISRWDVSSVTNMNAMFSDTAFNKDIGSWIVSSVTSMANMFVGSPFNQDISQWDVSSVTTMANMFSRADSFNQDIGDWDVSNVTEMMGMFASVLGSTFNQDLSRWDVSSVTDMRFMFSANKAFNQNIGDWTVSSVTNMANMFSGASAFDQDIGRWDVSAVTTMSGMFSRATIFNQNIGSWDVSSVTDMDFMFSDVTLSVANYDALLIGWSELMVNRGVPFHGGNSKYSSAGQTRKGILIDIFDWSVTDGGLQ